MTLGRTFALMCWYAVWVYAWWLLGWHTYPAAVMSLVLDIIIATVIGVVWRRKHVPPSEQARGEARE